MGGDLAPEEVVKGVAQASLATTIECVLVGDEPRIQAVLDTISYDPAHIRIHHAADAVGMLESPREALRAKRDASIRVGASIVAEGQADALVSAGNTGACLLACARELRTIKGVRKPALASVYPRHTDHAGQDPLALLLDVGATVRCDAADLVQFAVMGSAYTQRVSKVARPRVGLLNMGVEPFKRRRRTGGGARASRRDLGDRFRRQHGEQRRRQRARRRHRLRRASSAASC